VEAVVARHAGSPWLVEPPRVSYPGEPIEQGKMMMADPSGNLIEIKAYRHPEQVLGPPGEPVDPGRRGNGPEGG
jgi:extradiol dioxygenase family protein